MRVACVSGFLADQVDGLIGANQKPLGVLHTPFEIYSRLTPKTAILRKGNVFLPFENPPQMVGMEVEILVDPFFNALNSRQGVWPARRQLFG